MYFGSGINAYVTFVIPLGYDFPRRLTHCHDPDNRNSILVFGKPTSPPSHNLPLVTLVASLDLGAQLRCAPRCTLCLCRSSHTNK